MKNQHLKSGYSIGLALLTAFILFTTGCIELTPEPQPIDNTNDNSLGWEGSDEELEEIESSIYLGPTGDVPTKVDLTPYFPPIGSQGDYGTCVTWTIGYNVKTALDAMDKGYTGSALTSASKQFSPKDLFFAIDDYYKADDCNGTTFEAAFDILQTRGVATMATVPYTGMGDCFGDPSASWTNEASQYKINNYRKIDWDVSTIKSYLAQKRPIAIGCRVGDNFLGWNNGSSILSSDTYNYAGQHAYHAVTVVGYDDTKGSNGAFRVRNSWGDYWGDNGSIWIDYNFFESEFCFAAFVATNSQNNFNPDNNNDNQVDAEDLVSGSVDLLAWELEDFDNPYYDDPSYRSIGYNVFNMGSNSVYPSQKWSIMYMYYNAYDANEWDVLLFDYYTNEYDDDDHNGPLDEGPGISDNWWNNVTVGGGQSVAQALYGTEDARFVWGYDIPASLSGQYYFVLIADGYDDIEEADETNNYFYFTDDDGSPINVLNGVMEDPAGKLDGRIVKAPFSKPTRGAKPAAASVITPKNTNAYNTNEIREMISYHRKSGQLAEKVRRFQNRAQKTNKTIAP